MSHTLLEGALALVVAAVAGTLCFYGSTRRVRSAAFCIASLLAALLASGLAWYAWVESRSLAWTAAHSAAGVAALAACIRFGFKAAHR